MGRKDRMAELEARRLTLVAGPPAAPEACPTMRAEVVLVTPAQAAAWLEITCNANNRPIEAARVAAYARDMRTPGAWKQNGQGICFDTAGLLMNGQHRLWGVVEAGVAVPMLVVTGLPPDARGTIDKNKPHRLDADLAMLRGTPDPVRWAARLNAINLLVTGRQEVLTLADADRLTALCRGGLEWVAGVPLATGQRGIGQAPVLGALAFGHAAMGPAIEALWPGYASGLDLAADTPAYLLRRYVTEGRLRGRVGHDDRRVVMVKTLRAALMQHRGETAPRLQGGWEGVEVAAKAHGLTIAQ